MCGKSEMINCSTFNFHPAVLSVIITTQNPALLRHLPAVASLRGGGGGGPPRVSPVWGDTILWYNSSKKENNNMFNIIGNV